MKSYRNKENQIVIIMDEMDARAFLERDEGSMVMERLDMRLKKTMDTSYIKLRERFHSLMSLSEDEVDFLASEIDNHDVLDDQDLVEQSMLLLGLV